MRTKSKIIFLHLQKCAGTTFNMVMNRNYATKERINYIYIEGEKNDLKSLINKLNDKELEKIKYVSGHISYGIHEILPEGFKYITFLREPLSRSISHYYHLLRKHNYQLDNINHLHLIKKFHEEKILPLNLQVRRIAGSYSAFTNYKGNLFDKAISNIEKKFAFVGLSEKFDESLILIRKKIGLRHIYYFKKNVGSYKNNKLFLGKEVIDYLKENIKEDTLLYETIKGNFEIEIKKCEREFNNEIKRFRAMNRPYNQVISCIYSNLKKLKNII